EASALPLSYAPGPVPSVAPKEWATARARVAPPPSPDLSARTPQTFPHIKAQPVSHPAPRFRKTKPSPGHFRPGSQTGVRAAAGESGPCVRAVALLPWVVQATPVARPTGGDR